MSLFKWGAAAVAGVVALGFSKVRALAESQQEAFNKLVSAQPITIFTTSKCKYCDLAKEALKAQGEEFRTVELDTDQAAHERYTSELVARTHKTTVPNIFLCGASIGGYADLAALIESGKLQEKLWCKKNHAEKQQAQERLVEYNNSIPPVKKEAEKPKVEAKPASK